MPYLAETVTADDPAFVERVTAKWPFGPGFPGHLAERAGRLEIWHSLACDEGGDWTRFDLIDVTGRRIGVVRPGY